MLVHEEVKPFTKILVTSMMKILLLWKHVSNLGAEL